MISNDDIDLIISKITAYIANEKLENNVENESIILGRIDRHFMDFKYSMYHLRYVRDLKLY